jgi:hypothetical protein
MVSAIEGDAANLAPIDRHGCRSENRSQRLYETSQGICIVAGAYAHTFPVSVEWLTRNNRLREVLSRDIEKD